MLVGARAGCTHRLQLPFIVQKRSRPARSSVCAFNQSRPMVPERPQFACDVAVIGGGLGGLALAVGLRKRGFDVHVFEAAPELRTSTSTLIGLGGNAWSALGALDSRLVELIQGAGVRTQLTKFVTYIIPGAAPSIREDKPKTSLYTIRWAEVQTVLASLLPPDAVHCSHRAIGFNEFGTDKGGDESDGGVEIHFRGQPSVRARLAVAADGLRSSMRAALYPNDPGPRYLGHMNWNALLHNPGGNTVVDAHAPGELRVSRDGDSAVGNPFNIMTYVIDSGGGYTFWQVRIASPQPAFTNGAAALAAQDIGTQQATSVEPNKDNSSDSPAAKVKGAAQGVVKDMAAAAAQTAARLAARLGVSDGSQALSPEGEGVADGGEPEVTPTGATSGASRDTSNKTNNTSSATTTTNSNDSSSSQTHSTNKGLHTEAAAPAEEVPVHIVGGGLGVPGSKARVLQLLQQYGFQHEAAIVAATPEEAIFERAMLDRVPLDELDVGGTGSTDGSSTGGTVVQRMYSRDARVVLIGDAAHAMHSGPGQGARTAFEDAHTLVEALDRHRSQLGWCGGGSSHAASEASALAAAASEYQATRLARVCKIQRYAAEGCGLRELREKCKVTAGVVGLSTDEWRARMNEFTRWMEQYPELPDGDPTSTYWKPRAKGSAVLEKQ